MGLAELSLENVRSLRQARLDLHPGHNLIWGSNASGKTSLLEAVFLLGRGRSFRTRSSERLIRHGEPYLRVFGKLDASPPVPMGIEVSRKDGTAAKVAGAFVQSLAELSRAFAGSGDRAGRSQADRRGRATPTTLDGLGCVPRGTRVHRCVVSICAGTQAAKHRASGRPRSGVSVRSRTDPVGRADHPAASRLHGSAAALLVSVNLGSHRTTGRALLLPGVGG